jgi:hypothetical protein
MGWGCDPCCDAMPSGNQIIDNPPTTALPKTDVPKQLRVGVSGAYRSAEIGVTQTPRTPNFWRALSLPPGETPPEFGSSCRPPEQLVIVASLLVPRNRLDFTVLSIATFRPQNPFFGKV